MAGVWLEQPVETGGCILALFHEITVVAHAGSTGSSCFAPRSPVTDAGTACTPGMGKGACSWVLIVFVLWGWAHKKSSEPAAPVFLALRAGDVAQGVKQSGTGDKTQQAAGPALEGPVAPLITLTMLATLMSKYHWKICCWLCLSGEIR